MQTRPLFRLTVRSAIALTALLAPRLAGAEEVVPAQSAPAPVDTAIVPYRPAYSEWQAKRGLQLGARAAYSVGTGVVYSSFDVNDGSHGAVPIIVDLGARILPEFYIGLYGQYAFVIPKTNAVSCPQGFDCTVRDWRFGIEADYHFLPRSRFDPYIGGTFGYEILHNHVTGTVPVPTPGGTVPGSVDASVTDRGWEFAGITLGSDFRIDRHAALGVFFLATLGQYNVRSAETKVAVGPTTIAQPTPDVSHGAHELFMLGSEAPSTCEGSALTSVTTTPVVAALCAPARRKESVIQATQLLENGWGGVDPRPRPDLDLVRQGNHL